MADTEFKYDVFVSYSSANKDWVRKIFVPILEKAGLKVCDYYRDFDVGASIVKEMERAVLESRKTIPVLSPAYLNSGWTEFESLMLQTLDAANRERKLLPIIFETCELPLRIKYMNCINFANPDDVDIEWQRLSRALGVTLSPPSLDTKSPATVSRENWHLAHPYPMPPNFTGRLAERAMLTKWLNEDIENRLFIIQALGGFGKSALTWHWLTYDVDPKEWTKVLWWSFYEGDASFEHFIEETLKYLKLEVPQGQRPQVDELLKAMQSQKILLIMDGFERALRAYSSMNAAYQGDELKLEDNQLDCVNINAEIFLKSLCSLPNIQSKVLMTTRLTPRCVKPRGEFILGCREVELTSMQPADAVEFFHKQKIKGTHAEIEAACAPYGYHPLSLRLLAGRILKDFDNPADIVVAQKLKIDGDIIQQKHHVLEVSYNSLPQHEQKLLSTIACFRSPVELKTLEAISKPVKEEKPKGLSALFKKKTSSDYTGGIDVDLKDLVERGLLHFDNKNKKFDLHPIVRRFAYDRLMTPERTDVHSILVVYFEAIPQPQKIEKLEDLAPVIELYHHLVKAGKYTEAEVLIGTRMAHLLYFQFGAYQLLVELLQSLFIYGEGQSLPLDTDDKKAWALNTLAIAYSLSGQPRRAVRPLMNAIHLWEKANDQQNLAVGLENVAYMAQTHIGELRDAESNLRRSVQLSKDIGSDYWEGTAHIMLGHLLSIYGQWDESLRELNSGMNLFEKVDDIHMQSVSSDLLLVRTMLMDRAQKTNQSHLQSALQVLSLAENFAQKSFPIERDFVRAYWLLGVAYGKNDNLQQAEIHLNEALTRCRNINQVENEANILLDLARLHYDQKIYEEAKSLAEEALLITERCGYVLQGADVNLFLATLSLEGISDQGLGDRGRKEMARKYAEEAKRLAYCDGPPYYCKVAYEEAERMLKDLA